MLDKVEMLKMASPALEQTKNSDKWGILIMPPATKCRRMFNKMESLVLSFCDAAESISDKEEVFIIPHSVLQQERMLDCGRKGSSG